MPFALTQHAEQRVSERTSLTSERLQILLNSSDPVFTGHQPVDNRVQLVFYSISDNRFFVAIANMRDESIVTVLTLGQYRDSYGRIDDSKLLRAKRFALPGTPRSTRGLLLSCKYVDPKGMLRVRSLGRVDGFNVSTPPEVLAEDLELRTVIHSRCDKYQIDWNRVVAVCVRECNDDTSTVLPLDLPAADLLVELRWGEPCIEP